MDPALVERLVDGDGARLLAQLRGYAGPDAFAVSERLRAQGHDPRLVAAALTQARLRVKAEATFGDRAATMLFTADGLEQATRPPLAARHAERFVAAGIRTVHDLTVGIGSDAVALAEAGLAVRALDADPTTAAVAAANLRPWPRASVRLGRADTAPLEDLGPRDGVWLDPARRTSAVADARGRSRRVFSPEAMSPPWAQVLDIAARVPATGVKLSPAFPRTALPPTTEAQWTSWRGEVLECTVWWGPLVRFRGRTAAVCRPGVAERVVTEADCPEPQPPLRSLADLGPWLYEADRALVAAGLTGAVVAATGGAELARGVGLVGAERRTDLPTARRYAVLEAMPLHVKSLRSWLRQRGIGHVTVKKRGCPVDPGTFRQRLGIRPSDGAGQAVLLLTRVAGDTVVLVVDPRP